MSAEGKNEKNDRKPVGIVNYSELTTYPYQY